jgi:hypothetical protein
LSERPSLSARTVSFVSEKSRRAREQSKNNGGDEHDGQVGLLEQAIRLHGRASPLNAISPRARDHVTSSILSKREIPYCIYHHVSVHVKLLVQSYVRSITLLSKNSKFSFFTQQAESPPSFAQID